MEIKDTVSHVQCFRAETQDFWGWGAFSPLPVTNWCCGLGAVEERVSHLPVGLPTIGDCSTHVNAFRCWVGEWRVTRPWWPFRFNLSFAAQPSSYSPASCFILFLIFSCLLASGCFNLSLLSSPSSPVSPQPLSPRFPHEQPYGHLFHSCKKPSVVLVFPVPGRWRHMDSVPLSRPGQSGSWIGKFQAKRETKC